MPRSRKTNADELPSVEPAHPAPDQSPRPLGRDGLPEKQDLEQERDGWEHARQEPGWYDQPGWRRDED